MRIEVEAKARAPREAAFAVNADIADWPRFVRAIERIEIVTPGPVGAGTRFRETRTMFGRQATEVMTVAALQPPERLVLTAENHGVRYTATTEFLPAPNGTRIRLTFEAVPQTLAARIMSVVGLAFAGALRRQLEGDLTDLVRECERRAGTSGAAPPSARSDRATAAP